MYKLLIAIVCFSGVLLASGVKPVDNKQYINECGSCHFAFQPGLLPERSWTKIMNNLSNHFKTDASLEEKDTQTLLAYLTKNSSDNAMSYKRSSRITKSIPPSATPLRVTDTPYFKREHDEISQRVIERKSIGSFSNCLACHTSAERGIYDDDYVRIPKN